MESVELTIEGTRYRLRPWSYADGRRWLYELIAVSASAASAARGGASDEAAIGEIAEAIGVEKFEALCGLVEKYTDVVTTADGRELVQPLASIAAQHMRRRYVDLAALLIAHLKAEYSDFFAKLPGLLGARGPSERAR